MTGSKRIVIALGGNAISRPNEEGNVDQQFANSRATAESLANLVEQGHRLVITHGNGPQIGNFLLRNEAAAKAIYPLPMEVAVAHVQGGMGFMIAQTLTNALYQRELRHRVTAVITTILVDPDDPSFANPTKPIGLIFGAEEAESMSRRERWVLKEVSPGKFRRVVPSPQPLRIYEIDTIRRAVDAEDIIIACGGGGVPVIQNPDGLLHGVAAVIDKDFASALLASQLAADALMILTNVERVAVNFGKPDQRDVESMTLSEARAYFEEGQFPAGSMGPKVDGAMQFLQDARSQDAFAVIGPLDRAADAFAGKTGTRITRD
jgi:carbamate kinase